MPHYINGTEAKPGDLVRGKGYNIKDENGELAQIAGVLLTVTPNATACNVSLLVPDGSTGGTVSRVENGIAQYGAIVFGRIEYGQADHFEKIDPATEGASVDSSISHDPFAPEPDTVQGPLDARYHQDLSPAEVDAAAKAMADATPVEPGDSQEVPGTVETAEGEPGPAVNAETGEVTHAGEALPPIPAEASPADAQPTVDPAPESPPAGADAPSEPESDAQPAPEDPAVTEAESAPVVEAQPVDAAPAADPTPAAESAGPTEEGTDVPGQ